MSKSKNRINIVYSTNPDYRYEEERNVEAKTLSPGEQKLYIELDKKGRAGKQVSLISGFVGAQKDLESLSKQLKNLCGAGGGTDTGHILVQGDHREKIITYLIKQGYQVKRRGG